MSSWSLLLLFLQLVFIISDNHDCGVHDALKYVVNSNDAVCIDGSDPVYYLRRSAANSLNYLVFFEGGGWCYDLAQCYIRSSNFLGSSKNYPMCLKQRHLSHYLDNNRDNNPTFFDWNIAYVKYCDGGSYSSDASARFNGKKLFFKGKNIRTAIITHLLRNNSMSNAKSIVLAGCSAGGLGVLLSVDDLSTLIRATNPTINVRGFVDSGIFADFKGGVERNHVSLLNKLYKNDSANWFDNDILDYGGAMRNVFSFMNISAGTNKRCIKSTNNPSNCIFAEHLIPNIVTPIFFSQSKYDYWSLYHIVGNIHDHNLLTEFSTKVKNIMLNLVNQNPLNGLFMNSCTHHCTKCANRAADDNLWHSKNKLVASNSSAVQYTIANAVASWLQNKYSYFVQDEVYPCTNCCSCKLSLLSQYHTV